MRGKESKQLAPKTNLLKRHSKPLGHMTKRLLQLLHDDEAGKAHHGMRGKSYTMHGTYQRTQMAPPIKFYASSTIPHCSSGQHNLTNTCTRTLHESGDPRYSCSSKQT